MAMHLLVQGRPKGENKEEDKKKYSLQPVVSRLSQLIGQDVSAGRI
jgi:3-phosphoglycerate kinase